MKTTLLIAFLLTASIAMSQDALYLEYSGAKTGGVNANLTCKILKTADGTYIESISPNVTEKYLEIGDRAILLRSSKGDTGVVALLAHAGLSGIADIPHIPALSVKPKTPIDPKKTFVMLTGGTVAQASPEAFSMPTTRFSETGNTREIEAKLGTDVSAKVVQSDLVKEFGLEIPKKSMETYKDGRGPFAYAWTLTKLSKGKDAPALPTFESLLGKTAVVQDARKSELFSFSFSEGLGTFDEQYRKGEEAKAELEKQDKADSRSVFTAASIAGVLTLLASVVLLRRNRAPKT